MTTVIALATVALAPYTVRAVDRHVSFAGRLGQRVEITLHLERDGETRSVRLARRHSRTGRIPNFEIGEAIVLPDASPIAPEAVRRVRS